jgi:hypothetical protein
VSLGIPPALQSSCRSLLSRAETPSTDSGEDEPMSYDYKRLVMTIYNDVYDEHLFVFAAGLSYYFVLSLFPLLILIASALSFLPIPHLLGRSRCRGY